MLEERREAADDPSLGQTARDAQELVERHARFLGARAPRLGAHLVGVELALERREHAPLQRVELDDVGVEHLAQLVGAAAGLHAAPPHVADAEREQALRRHDPERLRADALARATRSAVCIEKPCGTLSVVHSR